MSQYPNKKIDAVEIIADLEGFVEKFRDLYEDARNLADSLKMVDLNRESEQMKLYLVNRMESFLEGREMFKFENLEKELKEILVEGDE
jgi:hypothetical protein